VSVLLIMLVYGIPLSLVLSALLLTMIRANPRLMLQDYPRDIQAAVPPKTPAEQRQTRSWCSPSPWQLRSPQKQLSTAS
jgi:hypothetical protein